MRILLTEDDEELAEITAANLKKDGFAVDLASLGKETIDLLDEDNKYDVIVLDLNLPDGDGIKLLKKLQKLAPRVPTMALTCKDAEENRVKGIQEGFDDYMTKPFSYHELVARLRVLYRSRYLQNSKMIKFGTVMISPQSQVVFVKKNLINLTLTEFRLLYYLVKNRQRLVKMDELLAFVWDRNGENGKGKVFTLVSRLRKKIGDFEKKIISSSHGGYIIN